VEDPQIKESQIYGVVKFKSGILTILYKLATSIYSSFIIITILALNVFISFKFSGKGTVLQLEEYGEEYGEEYVEEDEYETEEIERISEEEDYEIEEIGDEEENEKPDNE